jgi:hypothetical protein
MGQVPYGPVEQDDAVVTYGVKELLADINTTLIRVDTKLDSKADKSWVNDLEHRVVAVERGHSALKNRAIGAAAVASLLGGAIAARLMDLL